MMRACTYDLQPVRMDSRVFLAICNAIINTHDAQVKKSYPLAWERSAKPCAFPINHAVALILNCSF